MDNKVFKILRKCTKNKVFKILRNGQTCYTSQMDEKRIYFLHVHAYVSAMCVIQFIKQNKFF